MWNLNLRDDSPSGAIEHSLQGHSRAITDINFSAHHRDFLATCSVDGYVHCWDLRRPRQPALTFCDWFAGATQVKYNRQDSHILASSHDRWLHIWDDRKAVEPLKTISAHTSKIYGLDWNRTRATGVVTCSLDKSIKFWDYGREDDVAERVIRTDFPVWRARHTPFGWGILAMPQNEPGNLYLYDRRLGPDDPVDGPAEPVTTFSGHGNHKVKEFLWRTRGGISEDGIDTRDFQLVSWGEDNELRLQKTDPRSLEAVGYYRGRPARKNLNITRRGAIYKTFRTVDDSVHRDRRNATMSDPRPGSGGSQTRRSALTLGMHAPHRRVGQNWRGPSMKGKMPPHKDVDRSQLQIGWMKGITLARKKTNSDTPARSGSKDSTMFGSTYHDNEWAEPETIQEEFLHISNQLPNVKWENIDMDSLTLKASLKGPWGVDGESIFIKVAVDIPTNYPKSRAPKFMVEKTLFMPDQTHDKIEREVNHLANQFVKRKENCLAVTFSYLLGEVDLETSTSLFSNVGDSGDDMDNLADESSSDDDDANDIPTGGSASMSQELTASTELDPTTALAPTQRISAPPLFRLCGARFSNDGRLICFFPTKDQKSKALFPLSSPDAYRDHQKGEPNFAGFGRLAQDSPPPKPRFSNDGISAMDEQSGESDESDGSTSSSDSELTTMHKISLWYQPGLRFRRTYSANESVRSSGGGTGAGTGTGTGTSRKRPGKPKNILSIYDLRDSLPSKKQFAEEYAIFGDGSEVCEHNAEVARKYGYLDLVDIWKYAALLLRQGIPLEVHEQHNRNESVLVIARDVVSRSRDEDGDDTDLSFKTGHTNLSGRVKWGHHPLAQDFIHDLFDYFEKIADIQMLAMLSCIFGDSSTEDSVAYAESHLTQPETPLPMKAPSFSLEYFPTDPTLWNMHYINYKSQASSAITTPRTAHTPAMYSDSQGSEEPGWLAEPASHSYSCGETPPKSTKTPLRELGQAQSLSSSPDNRLFRRANHPAITAALAASLPRTLADIVAGSPPDPAPRKRPSPAEVAMSNLAPGVTWGGSTVMGASNEQSATTRTSMSDDDYRQEELMYLGPVGISCIPENQSLFDDDGWISTPLLSPSRNPMCAGYRYAYAEMLQMWGQPLARLEIMKFNVLKEDMCAASSVHGGAADGSYHESHTGVPDANGHTGHGTGATSPAIPFGGRKEQLQALLASGRGLDVTGICRVHETQLDPLEYSRPTDGLVGGAVGTCQRCQRGAGSLVPQTLLRCVYCNEPVDALYSACLGCGCASHEHCLAEWHAAGETECPAGDECNCAEEASHGHVESWPALQAAVAAARTRSTAGVAAERHNSFGGAALVGSGGGGALGRARRTSVPARLGPHVSLSENDEYEESPTHAHGHAHGHSRFHLHRPGNKLTSSARVAGSSLVPDDDEADREGWESVATSQGIPSASGSGFGRDKPAPHGLEPLSAARMSLGHRLKKSLGESARPSALKRQQSGGVTTWRKSAGLGG